MEQLDLVILGAGAAGMPAAAFAASGGRRVTLVEVADRIGGSLHLSSGQMSAAGTRLQAAKKIVDSPDRHFDDIMRISGGTANAELVRLAVDNAADTLHWLLDNGLEILPDHPIIHYGHEPYSVPRTYWGPEEGRSVLKVLAPQVEKAVSDGRIDLRLGTRLQGIRRDNGSGLVLTLESDKGRYEVAARDVIIATGGFSANPELFRELVEKPLYGGGWDYNRGDGLVAAVKAGGTIANRDHFLPTFAGVRDPDAHGGVTFATQTYPQFREPWELYVDGRGARFVREDDPSVDRRERALRELPGMRFWALFDDRIRREAPSFFLGAEWDTVARRFNKLPAYRCATSVSELAARIGADEATLAATIRAYNDAIVGNAPDPMGRQHRPLPIAEPPFYAVEHVGWSIVSFPGLGVNGKLQVVDGDGRPIPGLYAAGEVLGLGATSGNAFCGGMGVTPAMTFGRLLGTRLGQASVATAAAHPVHG